jgi:hypothetical protein
MPQLVWVPTVGLLPGSKHFTLFGCHVLGRDDSQLRMWESLVTGLGDGLAIGVGVAVIQAVVPTIRTFRNSSGINQLLLQKEYNGVGLARWDIDSGCHADHWQVSQVFQNQPLASSMPGRT